MELFSSEQVKSNLFSLTFKRFYFDNITMWRLRQYGLGANFNYMKIFIIKILHSFLFLPSQNASRCYFDTRLKNYYLSFIVGAVASRLRYLWNYKRELCSRLNTLFAFDLGMQNLLWRYERICDPKEWNCKIVRKISMER